MISEEVRDAVATGKPVVALETTIYMHGFPYPDNVALGLLLESVVRANGGIPATIAVFNGGMAGKRIHGSTTVSGTMILAHLAGIKVFGTADLTELGQTPMAVISSGCKSFLDIPRTIKYLKTKGVLVRTFANGWAGPVDFLVFFLRDSGLVAAFACFFPQLLELTQILSQRYPRHFFIEARRAYDCDDKMNNTHDVLTNGPDSKGAGSSPNPGTSSNLSSPDCLGSSENYDSAIRHAKHGEVTVSSGIGREPILDESGVRSDPGPHREESDSDTAVPEIEIQTMEGINSRAQFFRMLGEKPITDAEFGTLVEQFYSPNLSISARSQDTLVCSKSPVSFSSSTKTALSANNSCNGQLQDSAKNADRPVVDILDLPTNAKHETLDLHQLMQSMETLNPQDELSATLVNYVLAKLPRRNETVLLKIDWRRLQVPTLSKYFAGPPAVIIGGRPTSASLEKHLLKLRDVPEPGFNPTGTGFDWIYQTAAWYSRNDQISIYSRRLTHWTKVHSEVPAVSASKYQNLTSEEATALMNLIKTLRMPILPLLWIEVYEFFLFNRAPQRIFRLELSSDEEIDGEPIDSAKFMMPLNGPSENIRTS
ncbi:hypothetical protein VTN77DRAFT_7287 [Rasamsonia byssochlamydoides]|uniref:uncharacterized protein n=1 Tax=Rasamsonia byssochlamydoides TaxID=89139 RepID=UPI0037426893